MWSVGNRKSIKIWEYQWLKNHTSNKVLTPIRVINPKAKVEELMIRGWNEWNAKLRKSVFNEVKANVITTIPLSPFSHEDRQI